MELVTGFAGTAHIDPIDAAHLNVAGFGPDAYLLDTQNKLEASLETANKLVVGTGDLMIQGHHFTVIEPENIALQSGVSGQKRNALVCARYDKAEGTGVESASWIVKYGTATTGTPADPTVTSGDILDGNASVHEEPIFRIEYDGITPGDPILLVPEFQSAAKFRDSISQYSTTETSTGGTWIDGKPIYRKVIELGAITQGTTKSVNHGASIDSLINAYGIAYYENKSAYFIFPRTGFSNSSPNSGWDLNAFIDASAIVIQTGSSGSYDGGHIVLEYTKSY